MSSDDERQQYRARIIERAQETIAAARRMAEAGRALKRLAGPIPLTLRADLSTVVFGTHVESGIDLVVRVAALQHMLVVGTTGAGKSVFTHQLIYQLIHSGEVERLVLIDLKGGVEFYRYGDSPKVQVVWEFEEVVRVVDDLVALMSQRQDQMRHNGLQNWPGGRVVVVIDEYAEIQSDIDSAVGKTEKETARRLATNLTRIARRARSLGIVLVCALQKPTTDAMDSSLRTNLNCRICFRVGSRALAASVLDDLETVPADPVGLKPGRFIYYDAGRGNRWHVQAHVAPGLQLAGDVSMEHVGP
jgi:DNA helicase HerA-like ATPase